MDRDGPVFAGRLDPVSQPSRRWGSGRESAKTLSPLLSRKNWSTTPWTRPADAAMARTPEGGLYVEDDGAGLPGTDAGSCRALLRFPPAILSKLLRLPTRGALGNGLRVVVGAVLATGGQLTVKTRGRALCLRPRDADGNDRRGTRQAVEGQGDANRGRVGRGPARRR